MSHERPFSGSIGALAAEAGVTVETIRFYQRKGLLAVPARVGGGTRRYGPAHVARVRFVKAGQRLGFSLGEIAALLTLDDGTHCGEARALAEQKLGDVRAKLADLRRLEAALRRTVEACRTTRGTVACPLIRSLQSSGRR